MSEFDAFESAQQEEDPAADFLAKEQDQLASIEGEDFGFSQPTESQAPAGMLNTLKMVAFCKIGSS